MTRRLWLPVALTLLLSSHAAPSPAQNLLVNPGFDTGLGGWQLADPSTTSVTVSWDGAHDADGSPSSGSAKAVWQAPSVSGLSSAIFQCVEVTPGASYIFGGKVFIPAGPVPGSAFFNVIPYPSHGCSGAPPPSLFGSTPPVTTRNRWVETTATIHPFGPSVLIAATFAPGSGGTFQVSFDDVVLQPGSTECSQDATTLCLGGGRFKVTATFDAGNGNAGQAQVIPQGDSGLLWFFASSNIEAVVKVIDGCAGFDRFWFFAGGLTNVQVVITVTDLRTQATKTYTNKLGTAFVPIQDTSAFPCP
jgi:hypothetical protein